MKRLSLALLFLVFAVWPVWAQPVTVVGPITPGDCARFSSVTVLKDAGFDCTGAVGPIVFGPGSSVIGDVATWNNTTGTLLADTHVWIGVLSGASNLYASASGSDTNNNCTASGSPCTLKGACMARSKFAVFLSAAVNINIADGTYSAVDANSALCTNNGNAGNGPILTNLVGDCGTPGNVVLAVPANSLGVNNVDLGETSISCLTITGGNGSVGIDGGQFTVTDVSAVHFGAFGTNSVHVSIGQHSHYNINGSGEFIDGSASFHWQMRSSAFLQGVGTTITTNVAFSGGFLDTQGSVYIDLSNWTLTNSFTVTGGGATLRGPGYLITAGNAACNSIIPGGAGCTLNLCFTDSAGDLQADGKCLNSLMPAPQSAQGDILFSVGSGWYETLTGNSGAVRFLTENSSGVPSWLATIPVANGGTGNATAAAHSIPVSEGTSPQAAVGPCLTSQVVVGGGASADPTCATAPVAAGGTGNTTAAAHSIPVSEGTSPQAAVGPCLTNQVIVGGGASADPACGSNTAGSQQYLCTITASNSASLNNASPTSGSCPINGTYTSYKLIFQNIIPATDAKILELQIHSGGAYKATGYSYALGLWGSNTANVINSNTGTYIPLTYPADSNNISLHSAAPGFSGEITIINPSVSGIIPVFGQIFYIGAGGTAFYGVGQTGGSWLTAGVVDGFQVLMDSGNLTSGSILVYGIL